MLMIVAAEFDIILLYRKRKIEALKKLKIWQLKNCIYKIECLIAEQLIGSNVKLSLW